MFRGCEIGMLFRPAREVSGDFYLFPPAQSRHSPDALGDVAGKGMPAALTAVLAAGFLRSAAHEASSRKRSSPRRAAPCAAPIGSNDGGGLPRGAGAGDGPPALVQRRPSAAGAAPQRSGQLAPRLRDPTRKPAQCSLPRGGAATRARRSRRLLYRRTHGIGRVARKPVRQAARRRSPVAVALRMQRFRSIGAASRRGAPGSLATPSSTTTSRRSRCGCCDPLAVRVAPFADQEDQRLDVELRRHLPVPQQDLVDEDASLPFAPEEIAERLADGVLLGQPQEDADRVEQFADEGDRIGDRGGALDIDQGVAPRRATRTRRSPAKSLRSSRRLTCRKASGPSTR